MIEKIVHWINAIDGLRNGGHLKAERMRRTHRVRERERDTDTSIRPLIGLRREPISAARDPAVVMGHMPAGWLMLLY